MIEFTATEKAARAKAVLAGHKRLVARADAAIVLYHNDMKEDGDAGPELPEAGPRRAIAEAATVMGALCVFITEQAKDLPEGKFREQFGSALAEAIHSAQSMARAAQEARDIALKQLTQARREILDGDVVLIKEALATYAKDQKVLGTIQSGFPTPEPHDANNALSAAKEAQALLAKIEGTEP